MRAGLTWTARIVWFIFCLGVPVSAQTIASVSGTLTHGSSITIASGGTDFGTKPTAAPVKYEDIQSVTTGSDVSTSSAGGPTWHDDIASDSCHHPIASAAKVRPSTPFTKNWRSQWDDTCLNTAHGNSALNLTGQTFVKAYVDAWFYVDTTGITGGYTDSHMGAGAGDFSNLKMFRFHPTGAGSSGNPNPATSNGCQADLQDWFAFENDGVANQPSPYWQSGTGVTLCDRWLHIQWLIDAGSGNNAADGAQYGYIDGVLRHSSTNARTTNTGQSAYQEVYIGNYMNINNGAITGSVSVYWDSVYVDSSWARVEISNNSTYTSATHREICVPSAWSTSSITCTLNRGSFGASDNVFVHVCTATNSCSTGYAVQLGGGGSPDPVYRYRFGAVGETGLVPPPL